MNDIIKVGDKCYAVERRGDWTVCNPIKVEEAKAVTHRWDGKKVPMELWRQALAFLKWGFDTTSSETMIHFYYHQEHGWDAVPLPQKAYTGMTVKIFPLDSGHPLIVPTLQRLFGGDMDKIANCKALGDCHTHCNMSAFMSGGDHRDEIGKEGFHVTIGDMGKEQFSIHIRSSVSGEVLDAPFSDWFQLDPYIAENTPKEEHNKILAFQLTKAPKDVAFPEWWKANVIKDETPQRQLWATGNNHLSACDTYWQRKTPEHYQQKVNQSHSVGNAGHQTGYQGKGSYIYDQEMFEDDMVDLMKGFNMNHDDLLKLLEELQTEPARSLISSMVDHDQDHWYAQLIIEQMKEDEALEMTEVAEEGQLLTEVTEAQLKKEEKAALDDEVHFNSDTNRWEDSRGNPIELADDIRSSPR